MKHLSPVVDLFLFDQLPVPNRARTRRSIGTCPRLGTMAISQLRRPNFCLI